MKKIKTQEFTYRSIQAIQNLILIFFVLSFQVPKERCSKFERDPKPPVCRTANRLECKNVPQEECRQVIDTKCQQVPRQKCQQAKKSKCQQICEPVYWCKVCQL